MAPTVNVSAGTAAVLGLARIEMDVAPTTAYLMLGGRCSLACAFCAQARDSTASALHLSRITWPQYDRAETVLRLREAAARGSVKRACLQVTVGHNYHQQALDVLRAIRAASDAPVDVSILPQDMRQVEELLAAGAEHIGFGLDAAGERVFRQTKGGNWIRHLRLIEEAAGRFPGRVAVHLIVGLGETEREMVEMIQHMHDLGVTVGLFAFTPVRGTAMEDALPPPLAVYRRMQAARHLITHNLARAETFAFSETGQLTTFNVPHLQTLVADGVAFQTSGCPDCNRPFYNERPGSTMYNYPRPLTADEAQRAWAEMWPTNDGQPATR